MLANVHQHILGGETGALRFIAFAGFWDVSTLTMPCFEPPTSSLFGASWEEMHAVGSLASEGFQLASGAHCTECNRTLAFTRLSEERQRIQQAGRRRFVNVLEKWAG